MILFIHLNFKLRVYRLNNSNYYLKIKKLAFVPKNLGKFIRISKKHLTIYAIKIKFYF